MPETKPHYSVVIIGSGPTGLTLANLLGREGVDVLLVERNTTTVLEPRAVSIDDESLRTMQAVRLVDVILQDVVAGYGSHYYGADGRCFARVEPRDSPYGYQRRNAFRQPLLERALQDGLDRFPAVEALYGWRLQHFEPSQEYVAVSLTDPSNGHKEITCAFLVGCDGADSTVRRILGVPLEGTTFSERWLIVDLENHDNTDPNTKVYCNSRRPCITLPGPHRTRRFEFKLHSEESDGDVLALPNVQWLLAAHGSDPHAALKRKVVYRFHARVAKSWSKGRVFLAGDAAHLSPPFAGQGMNSGIRDAHNLSWKLAAVLRRVLGPRLLDSYEQERRNHVWQMIRLALRMGKIMAPRSIWSGRLVQSCFRALGAWPAAKDYFVQMKYKPKPKFAYGFLIPGGDLVGRLLPQPTVSDVNGRSVRLDDVLGDGFALLARSHDPQSIFSQLSQPIWDRLACRRVGLLPEGTKPKPVADVTLASEQGDTFGSLPTECLLLLRPDRYVAAYIPVEAIKSASASVERLVAQTW